MLKIIQLPVLSDNYVYLVHEPIKALTMVVDPPLSEPVIEELKKQGWNLDFIFNTHHHWDHTDANVELKKITGAKVIGSKYDEDRIPGIDQTVTDGEMVSFGAEKAKVFFLPGHTTGHIAYWFQESQALFCGDVLFSLGCGRVMEGTFEQMWNNMQVIRSLPDDTRIYCAHEYTEKNGKFALTIEPNNKALIERMSRVRTLRQKEMPTVPALLKDEKAANPFLRADCKELQENLNLIGASALEVFTEVRRRKDKY